MEPPQHEATSCQIDVVTSRQVSMLWPAVFHNNNSWNCLLLACSHTHIFKWTLPSSGFSQHPRGRVRGKPVAFKFKKNKFHFRTFSCLLTLEIIKFSQKKWQERVKNTPCYPGDPLIVIKNSIKQQRWEYHTSLVFALLSMLYHLIIKPTLIVFVFLNLFFNKWNSFIKK